MRWGGCRGIEGVHVTDGVDRRSHGALGHWSSSSVLDEIHAHASDPHQAELMARMCLRELPPAEAKRCGRPRPHPCHRVDGVALQSNSQCVASPSARRDRDAHPPGGNRLLDPPTGHHDTPLGQEAGHVDADRFRVKLEFVAQRVGVAGSSRASSTRCSMRGSGSTVITSPASMRGGSPSRRPSCPPPVCTAQTSPSGLRSPSTTSCSSSYSRDLVVTAGWRALARFSKTCCCQ